MPVKVETWAKQIRAGDIRAISRAMTAIENRLPVADELLRSVFLDTGQAFRIGVTGAPGTGKSTLVDRLAAFYRRKEEPVGVIAVDPTSPFTGGAILGDRIRMQGHAGDRGIFIRSMATRGFLGGLSRSTADAALLLDAAGKKILLIETVGVGQDEVDIVRLADCTVVLLVPGFGDDVQNMKAGLMEIGDLFVINKADREGADRLEQQLRAMLQLAPERNGWKPPILRTIATEGRGIEEVAASIAEFERQILENGQREARKIAHWKRRLLELLEARLIERAMGDPSREGELDEIARRVANRKLDPYAAVDEIMAAAGLK